MTKRTEKRVKMMTTGRVLVGTRPAASLHQWSAAEDAIEITVSYVMSSLAEMHAAGLKIGAEIVSVKNSTMKGTMITMVPTMTNLTRSCHQKWDLS
jgi:hypothetical protein